MNVSGQKSFRGQTIHFLGTVTETARKDAAKRELAANRRLVAEHLNDWLQTKAGMQTSKKAGSGAIICDFDDTLVNDKEKVDDGFESIRKAIVEASLVFSLYIVTARPMSDHRKVVEKLRALGFAVAPSHLFMMTDDDYFQKGNRKVALAARTFKWESFLKIQKKENGNVLLRMGDRLWDILPEPEKHERAFEKHIDQRQAFMFLDNQSKCLCVKLPEAPPEP